MNLVKVIKVNDDLYTVTRVEGVPIKIQRVIVAGYKEGWRAGSTVCADLDIAIGKAVLNLMK